MSKYNEVMDNIKVSEEMRQRILENIEKEISEGTLAQETDQAKDISKSIKSTDKTNTKRNLNKEKIIRFITFYGSRAAVFLLIVAGAYGVFKAVGLDNHQTSAPSSTMYEAESSYDAEAESEADYAEAPAAYEEAAEAPEMSLMDTEEAAEEVETETVTEGAFEGDDLNALQPAQESNAIPDNAIGAGNKAASESEYISPDNMQQADSVSEMSDKLGYSVEEISFLSDNSSDVDYSYCSEGGEITYHSDYGTIHQFASDKGIFTGNTNPDIENSEVKTHIDAGAKTVDAYGEDGRYNTLIWDENGITYVIVSENGLTEDMIREIFK